MPHLFPVRNCTGNVTNDFAAMDLCSVLDLLTNVLQILLYIAAAVAIFFICIGAYHYFTAFGNEEKAAQGKKTIIWAIVGVFVVLLSYVIVREVWNLLSSHPFTPTR